MKRSAKRQVAIALSLVAAVCITFFHSITVFSTNSTKIQNQEVLQYLEGAASNTCHVIASNFKGNLQVLSTLATSLGYTIPNDFNFSAALHNSDTLAWLHAANMQNNFLRMGVVDTNYNATLVSLTGVLSAQQDLSEDQTIQKAMKGNFAISEPFWDDSLNAYINRYAVPIYKSGVIASNHQIIGVLTGCQTVENTYRLLNLNLPRSTQTNTHIINSSGKFVLRNQTSFFSSESSNIFDSPTFTPTTIQLLTNALNSQTSAFIEVKQNQSKFELAMLPLNVNDWFLLCIVPRDVLVSSSNQWFNLQHITFLTVILALIFLTLYIYYVMRQNNRSIHQLAYHDGITGAYNRGCFMQKLPTHLTSRPSALVVLNITNAATLKSLYGLNCFNTLLCRIKEILDDCCTSSDLFCLGRNERFLLLIQCANETEVTQWLDSLFQKTQLIRISQNQTFPIVCHAGVRFVTENQSDLEHIVNQAGMTSETGTQQRKNQILFFDPSIYEPAVMQVKIEESMENALLTEEFKVFFQPKIEPSTNLLRGAEALVRWVRSDGSMIYPDQFIPVFEKNGFCVDLDFYMVEQACRQLRGWIDAGYPVVPISINQCRLMFYSDGYVQRLCSILNRWNIAPRLIVLEVTESIALDNVENMLHILLQLRELGFRIAMDDFGSGFSSLNFLKEMPIDELKLDRVFLSARDDTCQTKQDLILKNMILLAKDLHISAVVEGVETAEQAAFLRSIHCDLAQGYYYDRPLDAQTFEEKYLL